MSKDPEDMTEAELLIQINQQLALLRQQNDRLIQILTDDFESQLFKCQTCGEHVAEDEREAHQIESHNAPNQGVDLLSEYVEL